MATHLSFVIIDSANASTAYDVFKKKLAGLTLLQRAIKIASVSGGAAVLVHLCEPDETTIAKLNQFLTKRRFKVPVEVSHSVSESAARLKVLSINQKVDVVKCYHAHTTMSREVYLDAAPVGDSPVTRISTPSTHQFAMDIIQLAHVEDLETTLAQMIAQKLPETTPVVEDPHWSLNIVGDSTAQTFLTRMDRDTYKDLDGPGTTYVYRPLARPVTALLINTPLKPNHISLLGMIFIGGGIFLAAASGHYKGFFLAGLLCLCFDIFDCVDGSIARQRYDYSLSGEWLDTIADDMSDIFLWGGLGIGAYRTYNTIFGSHSIWLWLGGLSILFKLISMGLYYSYLIRIKRGDLLAFPWSFDQKENSLSPEREKLMKMLKNLLKKDSITLISALLGLFYLLPYLLFVGLPGNIAVVVSVFLQRKKNIAALENPVVEDVVTDNKEGE